MIKQKENRLTVCCKAVLARSEADSLLRVTDEAYPVSRKK